MVGGVNHASRILAPSLVPVGLPTGGGLEHPNARQLPFYNGCFQDKSLPIRVPTEEVQDNDVPSQRQQTVGIVHIVLKCRPQRILKHFLPRHTREACV